jgi:hypothetical protein
MPYFVIENFASGLDLRRPPLAAPQGTLSVLKNAHVTAGGDIEKRYAFVPVFQAPGTFGLAGIGTQLYVFRQAGAPTVMAADAPVPQAANRAFQPLTIHTISLPMPAGKTAERLVDWELFNSKIYSVIKASDGTFHHFYGDTYVADVAKMYDPAPNNVKTFKGKLYGIAKNKVVFSAIDNPLIWDPADTKGLGQGFIETATNNGTGDALTGIEVYYDQLAISSRYATQIWEVDADPKNNNLRQTLRGAGTAAPPSMLGFGSGDVLYLHDSGVRSLRAKDSSNAAAVSDIGSPIDPTIQKIIKTASDDAYVSRAFSLIEPNTGRFWLCFPDRIFLLSFYPGPKVTAWSEYDPGFRIDGGVVANSQVALRSGDDIYLYGGATGEEYDACEVSVDIPYLSVSRPATLKAFTGLDLAAWGPWTLTASYDPNRPDAQDVSAAISEPTLGQLGTVGLQGVSTHISLNLRNQAPGAAKLSMVAVHYRSDEKAD